MSSTMLKDTKNLPQERQKEPQPHSASLLSEAPRTSLKPEVTCSEDHQRSSTSHQWFEMIGAPRMSLKPEVTFSEGQYISSTYHHWFERHTGLSLDEAIALGLAEREHAST